MYVTGDVMPDFETLMTVIGTANADEPDVIVSIVLITGLLIVEPLEGEPEGKPDEVKPDNDPVKDFKLRGKSENDPEDDGVEVILRPFVVTRTGVMPLPELSDEKLPDPAVKDSSVRLGPPLESALLLNELYSKLDKELRGPVVKGGLMVSVLKRTLLLLDPDDDSLLEVEEDPLPVPNDKILDEFWARVEVLKVEGPLIDVLLKELVLVLLTLALVADGETTGKNIVEWS